PALTERRKRITALRQHADKIVAEQIGVFAFTQRRHRVEPDQFVVDLAGVAHDQAAIGEAVEKLRKQFLEHRARLERISAGESGIGAYAVVLRETAKAAAQRVKNIAFGIRDALRSGRGAAALADPGLRRALFHRAQQRFADLRKDVDVLMAVDIIRSAAEGALERRELGEDFSFEQRRTLQMRERAAGH